MRVDDYSHRRAAPLVPLWSVAVGVRARPQLRRRGSDWNGDETMAKQRAWRLIALMISCTGLTASVLACSTAPADSTAEAAATIRQEETSWIKDLGARQI